MQSSDLWSPSTVFVETGMRNGRIGLSLVRAGLRNYLGLSSDRRRVAQIQSQHPELASHVTYAPWRRSVEMNNAQVVILSGFTVLYLWRYRALRHAEEVAWSANLNALTYLGMVGWVVSALLFRRFSRLVWVECRAADGRSQRLIVSRVLRRKSPHLAARHYIPHALGLGGFLKALGRMDAPYAVLRWFEGLPHQREGRDIDLLVDDAKFEEVRALLNSKPGIELADVYTPSGLPKSDYFGAPYYPTENARQVLARTRDHAGFCQVPAPLDHFNMLIYHAIYHNGPRSGLPSRDKSIKPEAKPAHDYIRILRELSEELGIQVELTLEGLHEYLGTVGWAPRPDMLARMAAHYTRNPWLKTLSGKLSGEVNDNSLTVFCIRKKAVDLGLADQAIEVLKRGGWNILAVKKLSDEESRRTAIHLRGGTWDKGVFPTSGGPPLVIAVGYDLHPITPTRAQRKKDPNIVNARQLVKYEVRRAINAQVNPDQEFSAIHSTDFGGEAWYCLELCMPERLKEIRGAIANLRETMASNRKAA